MIDRHQLTAYWNESRRPLVSLWFVLPMLAAYEIGVLVMPTTMRNGADAWMRGLLDVFGLGGYFLLPSLTVAGLLAWHHLSQQPWRARRGVLAAMLGEAVVLGLFLVAVARVHGLVWTALAWNASSASMEDAAGSGVFHAVGQAVAFCGAGIYEEMLFRLLLVPFALWLGKLAGLGSRGRITAAIVATSLLFSAAHYVGSGGDAWNTYSFLFRFSAGMYFAVLFVYRGFGIAAGTHALYDVLVGVWGI